jgi:hypothetical protein
MSDTVTVRVHPRPDPRITVIGDRKLCEGDTVVLDAGAGHRQYLWRPGNQTTRTIRVTRAGTYSVEVENEFQCRAVSSPVTITINPLPDSTITALRPRVFCEGDSTILSGAAGMATYRWKRGDSTFATGRIIVLKTDGKVTLTVTDTNGCTASSSPGG